MIAMRSILHCCCWCSKFILRFLPNPLLKNRLINFNYVCIMFLLLHILLLHVTFLYCRLSPLHLIPPDVNSKSFLICYAFLLLFPTKCLFACVWVYVHILPFRAERKLWGRKALLMFNFQIMIYSFNEYIIKVSTHKFSHSSLIDSLEGYENPFSNGWWLIDVL